LRTIHLCFLPLVGVIKTVEYRTLDVLFEGQNDVFKLQLTTATSVLTAVFRVNMS